MKKKDFVSLIMSVIGSILFGLGMCAVMLPEWNATFQGVLIGLLGLIVLMAMVMLRRVMEGKPPIVFNGRSVAITLYGTIATVVFGLGLCMTMVWSMLFPGIIVGIIGILLLLFLIPLCYGLQQ